jgi:hypothetical protein
MPIRLYGPGKFDTILDSFLYVVSLDGADDEVSEENQGWSGMLYGDGLFQTVIEAMEEGGESVDPEEANLLQGIVNGGVILTESTDGFVYVTYHETKKKLLNAWDTTKEDYE